MGHQFSPIAENTLPAAENSRPSKPQAHVPPLGRAFLGVTSYADVFSEGMERLNAMPESIESSPMVMTSSWPGPSKDQMAQSLRALKFLEDYDVVDSFVGSWLTLAPSSCIYLPSVMRIWMQRLQTCHRDVLLASSHPETKQKLCETIWRNTRTPIPVNENTTAEEWSTYSTGSGLRWEVIGLIAITLGMSVASRHASHPDLANHGIKQIEVVSEILRVSDLCLSMCRECNDISDLFL